jgi:hypothetical protein
LSVFGPIIEATASLPLTLISRKFAFGRSGQTLQICGYVSDPVDFFAYIFDGSG